MTWQGGTSQAVAMDSRKKGMATGPCASFAKFLMFDAAPQSGPVPAEKALCAALH
jgi:hypothetical protein